MTPIARNRRYLKLKELGCICFRRFGMYVYPEIHHLNFYGKAGQERRGDEFTIPLSKWHHQGIPFPGWSAQAMREAYGPSLKLHSRKFREVFGDDDSLLAEVNRLINPAC